MAMTIIGIYDEFQPAFSAKNELLASDFSWTEVSLTPDHEIPPRERSGTPHTDPSSASYVIGKMFTGLFDVDGNASRGNVYGEAVRRGGYVVTVDVESEPLRAQAEAIIQRWKPVHTEARQARGASSGVGATPGLTGS
jgi:hypothetical protein